MFEKEIEIQQEIVENETKENVEEIEVPNEEKKQEISLTDAIDVIFLADEKELGNLNEEYKKKLETIKKSNITDNLEEKVNWTVRALNNINASLLKTLEENEEFRVTSKVTLQKNVQLLEEQVKGNQFNKLLRPIAQLYSNYEFMLSAPIDEEKTRSNIEGILEEIESFLMDYGIEKIEANVGDDFDPLNFKISKKIETDDINLDKKVANVKQPGWKKERFVLVPLRADMYVYNENK